MEGDSVVVSGELDIASADQLHRVLSEQLADHPTTRLGLAGVTFMDSSGLRILVHATERFRSAGGDLVIENTSPRVERLFDVTGTDAFFTIRRPDHDWLGLPPIESSVSTTSFAPSISPASPPRRSSGSARPTSFSTPRAGRPSDTSDDLQTAG